VLRNCLEVNTLQTADPLTPQEVSELRELEDVIQEGLASFLKTGLAFGRIRYLRLYRATHDTFESYCQCKWGLSLSRTNQIIRTCEVCDNITNAFPQDAALLADTNEHGLRPLSRLAPELQVAAWELIKHVEERPRGTTIEEVVDTIRNAITAGWEERTERQSARSPNQEPTSAETPSAGALATESHSTNGTTKAARQSDELATFSRWANRVGNWSAETIVAGDDTPCLKRRLMAATQLKNFCENLITTIEARLLGQNPATTTF
jgi:hypothetical protein